MWSHISLWIASPLFMYHVQYLFILFFLSRNRSRVLFIPIVASNAAVSILRSASWLLVPTGLSKFTLRSPNIMQGQRRFCTDSFAIAMKSSVVPFFLLGGIYTLIIYQCLCPDTRVALITLGPNFLVLSRVHSVLINQCYSSLHSIRQCPDNHVALCVLGVLIVSKFCLCEYSNIHIN